MTDIPEYVRADMKIAVFACSRVQSLSEAALIVDRALSALRAAGYEVRRSDHIAALESLATGAADILPLVSEWFHASEAERAAEGIDWECRAHMGVLAVMHEAQALAPPAPSK